MKSANPIRALHKVARSGPFGKSGKRDQMCGAITRILRGLGIATSLLFCFNCGHEAIVRPTGIPLDATYVAGGKVGGWWQQCMAANAGKAVHCRIWNGGGLVLYDEEFLPYDGGAAPTAEELKILPDPTFQGSDRIFLTNNRILLPRHRFEELKLFVDWLYGKRSSPR